MILSILIAAYNVEKYIEKCINSCYVEILSKQYEIIVVNDGSTDETFNLATALAAGIDNLTIIDKKNEGLGAARNEGILKAKGDYVWMIDGDDFIETAQLLFIFNELKSSRKDIYCFNYNITNSEGVVQSVAYSQEHNTQEYDATSYYELFKANSYTWQYIFNKSMFLENNLFFKPSINMQDSEILPKIIYFAVTVKYTNSIVYNYVQHEFSFTNAKNFEKRLRYFKSIIAVNQSLENFRVEIQDKNKPLETAIAKKQESLHEVVFNHLVFFNYTNKNLQFLISLLKNANFYPLQSNAHGKMKMIKIGLNHFPETTKLIIDKLRRNG